MCVCACAIVLVEYKGGCVGIKEHFYYNTSNETSSHTHTHTYWPCVLQYVCLDRILGLFCGFEVCLWPTAQLEHNLDTHTHTQFILTLFPIHTHTHTQMNKHSVIPYEALCGCWQTGRSVSSKEGTGTALYPPLKHIYIKSNLFKWDRRLLEDDRWSELWLFAGPSSRPWTWAWMSDRSVRGQMNHN